MLHLQTTVTTITNYNTIPQLLDSSICIFNRIGKSTEIPQST